MSLTLGRTLVPRPLGRCLILALAVLFAAVPLASADDAIPLGRKSAAVQGAFAFDNGVIGPSGFLPDFDETPVFTGLSNPMAIRWAPDGRIFIAEKGGKIKEFNSLTDPTPTVVADISTEVYDFWDR